MAELKRQRKVDLIALAEELNVELVDSDKINDIITKIISSDDFDEELAIAQVKNIKEDREDREREAKDDREREIREREEKEHREHELAKIQAMQNSDVQSVSSNREENPRNISLKSLMRPFDEDKSEISLFLALFEKQAKKVKLNEDDYVMQLLTLLPIQLAEGVMKLSEEQIDNYETVKTYLLERFRVNAETYRIKFIRNQKLPSGLWKDLVFELRTYLTGWLNELEVSTFDDLKNLMISDQLKRRASPEMKEKFLDQWSQIVDPENLAAKLDDFESVRKPFKKQFQKFNADEKKTDRYPKFEKTRERKLSDKRPLNWRDRPATDSKERDRQFEKRKQLACYECGSFSHLRPSCPQLKKENVMPINNIEIENSLGESFEPYLLKAKINEKESLVLIDSGSGADVVPERLINPNQLNGETMWVKTPFENRSRRYPVAKITLDLPEIGQIETKAIVVDSTVNLKYYILGNKSLNLIGKLKQKCGPLNAVITCNEARDWEIKGKKSQSFSEMSPTQQLVARRREEKTTEVNLNLHEAINNASICSERVSREEFSADKQGDPLMTGFWEKGEASVNETFALKEKSTEEERIISRTSSEQRGKLEVNKRKETGRGPISRDDKIVLEREVPTCEERALSKQIAEGQSESFPLNVRKRAKLNLKGEGGKEKESLGQELRDAPKGGRKRKRCYLKGKNKNGLSRLDFCKMWNGLITDVISFIFSGKSGTKIGRLLNPKRKEKEHNAIKRVCEIPSRRKGDKVSVRILDKNTEKSERVIQSKDIVDKSLSLKELKFGKLNKRIEDIRNYGNFEGRGERIDPKNEIEKSDLREKSNQRCIELGDGQKKTENVTDGNKGSVKTLYTNFGNSEHRKVKRKPLNYKKILNEVKREILKLKMKKKMCFKIKAKQVID